MKKEFLEIGKIVNTHGVRGEVKVQPWADSPEFLLGIKTLYLDGEPLRVRGGRVHKGMVILALEGVEDVNAAMALKNRVLHIGRGDARLPAGSFFLQDIIGAKVVTEQGEELGELADVLDLPGNAVYVVRGAREILIPAVPEFILHTDAENGVVTVRLIEGL
jgi:16S rRNA processing protein RimM